MILLPVLLIFIPAGCGRPAAVGSDGGAADGGITSAIGGRAAAAGGYGAINGAVSVNGNSIYKGGSLAAALESAPSRERSGFSVVCTLFPQYDWVTQILGENPGGADVTLLLKRGIDLHNYQPSVDDIVKISECDLFIYVGGISDGWVGGALKNAVNEDMVVINLLETLGSAAKPEEILEGMQDETDTGGEGASVAGADANSGGDMDAGEDADGGMNSGEDADSGGGMDAGERAAAATEYDEHVWLSLTNAQKCCAEISYALVWLDRNNADIYLRNAAAYAEKLAGLDARYYETVKTSPVKTLLFADRFPFRYMADDYGIRCYAAFPGCSAEAEASFETIAYLAGKMDELNLKNIIVTENSDRSIARTVAASSAFKDPRILVLDSMQSEASVGGENGPTYFSVMESNLEVLAKALR